MSERRHPRLQRTADAAHDVLVALGLSTALVGLGCQPRTQTIDIDIVTSEDADALQGADNASLVVEPNGDTQTVVADGLDFEIALSLDPDDELRTASLYLAQGETLLAWGRTAEFTYTAALSGIGVFLGTPGGVTTFPLVLDLPDDRLLATAVDGRGAVLLASDGSTSYLDGFTLDMTAATPLASPPDAGDGALVGDGQGGAMRVAWAAGLSANRFDPGDDTWVEVEHDGGDAVVARPGAAWLVDAGGSVLSLFGGGEATDVVSIDLVPRDDGSLQAGVVDGIVLDAPRAGASAMWLLRDDGDDGEDILLFGTADTALAVGYLVGAREPVGPVGAWHGARCIALPVDTAVSPYKAICGGGIRGDAPTADVVVVSRPNGVALVEEQPGLLGNAIPSPLWTTDAFAVYAHGEGAVVPLDVMTLQPAATFPALRGSGGQTVALEGGATLIVGGTETTGVPATRMQVFTPRVQ